MPTLAFFYRLIVRPLRREPSRTLLTAFAVALGVAVVLAIELAGGAAAGSFRSSVETLVGDADFEITAAGGVPPVMVARLASLPYALKIRPRIEDFATIEGSNRTVPFIGVDMLTESMPGGSPSGGATFQSGDSIWAGPDLGLKVGQHMRFAVNDAQFAGTVRGVLGTGSGAVLVTDLAPATRILGRTGTLDRILVQVPAGRTLEEWERILRQSADPGVTIARQGSRTNENRRMLEAFRWNLRVLSYIALVVGAFLIYNTISVSVVRRRAEIGIVRALGATRGQVLTAFLGEGACFGIAGGLAGLVLGRLMAEGTVKLVAATVDSLYVSSRPAPIALHWGLALLAVLAGVGVAVASAFAPAWEASRIAPVEAMARGRSEHEAAIHKLRNLAIACGLGLGAWAASRQGPVEGKPLFGYAATVLLIAASTLAIPALVSVVARGAAGIMGRLLGPEALLAFRSLAGSLRRTSVLVGALSTAIAMMAAVGIMVGSFRETVLQWMGDRLQADLYLRPAVPAATDRHPVMSPDLIARLRLLPEVAEVDALRAYEISYEGLPVTLAGSNAKFARQAVGDSVMISEPFAEKHHVRKGDTLELPLGGKPARFRVAGIYYDYSSERGTIAMDRATLLRYLPDPAPSNIAVYLKKGVDLDQSKRSVEQAIAGRKVLVFSNRTLRVAAIQIFDRTFAITYALEAVAILVAILGVAGALVALVIDRRRELGLMRFLGAATGQVRRMILFEAGLLGLLANLAGLILGSLLSLLLIFVINKQSFGWTIQFHWPVATLLGALSLVFTATVLAGLYPAQIAMRMNPIEVIHED